MLLPALADLVCGGHLHCILVLLYEGEPRAGLTWPGWLRFSCLSAPSRTRTPAPGPGRASPACLHRVHRELLAAQKVLCGAGQLPPAAVLRTPHSCHICIRRAILDAPSRSIWAHLAVRYMNALC